MRYFSNCAISTVNPRTSKSERSTDKSLVSSTRGRKKNRASLSKLHHFDRLRYSTSHSCLNFNRVISRPVTSRFLAISFARRFVYEDKIDQMISPKLPARLLALTARLCHPFTLMPHYLKSRRMDERGKIDLHARSDKGTEEFRSFSTVR